VVPARTAAAFARHIRVLSACSPGQDRPVCAGAAIRQLRGSAGTGQAFRSGMTGVVTLRPTILGTSAFALTSRWVISQYLSFNSASGGKGPGQEALAAQTRRAVHQDPVFLSARPARWPPRWTAWSAGWSLRAARWLRAGRGVRSQASDLVRPVPRLIASSITSTSAGRAVPRRGDQQREELAELRRPPCTGPRWPASVCHRSAAFVHDALRSQPAA
jgi:hypothetical protein